jgi:hypothetical protein
MLLSTLLKPDLGNASVGKVHISEQLAIYC